MSTPLEGWRWVPVEATEEMVEAICRNDTTAAWPNAFGSFAQEIRRGYARAGWDAALAAAPHPPIAPDAGLAARLEQHARIHDEHVPHDAEQARWAADLRAAAEVVRQPDALRAAAEQARAALSDLLLRRDPIVYSDALRALDEALAGASAQPQAGPTDEEIATWVDSFILAKAFNRPIAVQIAVEAAKWVRSRLAQPRAAGWRPIETAPRGSGEDGPSSVKHPDYVEPPHLLLWSEDGMRIGYYDWYYHPLPEPPKEGA